ncbi:hypothetical protein HF521_004344 [Silurus meridionalis]|uniref:Homologous-pairing protein 2 homolog n=1 Tax=Silurus meridionalis TaxID=175797 RepID=A0A8T0AZ38_SILME|nr:hypothetical protein HF521_004344 [Silurus meridionalis]
MSKKDSGAADLILSYLNEKNRPYSAQDVFGNLQKQHGLGKTAVVKAMEQLAQDGRIREKVYGKQKIYFADQSQFSDVSDSDLKQMDSRISELSRQVETATQSCRQLDTELKELNSSLTTEREKVYKERILYVKEWKKRKRLAADMMGAILEGYPKSKKEFLEEVGVETDEDHKVKIPNV